jgi:putative FmdB family regulatory protein
VPTYDYVCSACANVIEVVHGILGHGPRVCRACGAEGTLRKTITTPAVHFKGSGWAKKDRRSGAVTKAAAKTGAGDGSGAEPTAGRPAGSPAADTGSAPTKTDAAAPAPSGSAGAGGD